MMDEFAKDWTYRTALVTVVYRKGEKVTLDPIVQLRARKAGVLVPPKVKGRRYGRRTATPRSPRHIDEA